MTIETLVGHNELMSQPNTLPIGDALRHMYELEFAALDLPKTYRTTDDFFESNVRYDGSKPNINALRDLFITQAADKAYHDSWWVNVSEMLEEYAIDPSRATNLAVVAKHELDIFVDGKATGQGFEVFEVGDKETQDVIETVLNTLQLADQYSGGLLAADPQRPVVALLNGIRLHKNKNGIEGLARASEQVVTINMSALKEVAEEHNADPRELLSTVIMHEVLGHSLERLVTPSKKTGLYLSDHFDYSTARVPGKLFDNVHESIEPRDPSHHDSQPVREYGSVSAAEDLATSVDATIAQAMGWSATTDKIPRSRSTMDFYRRDLATELMQQAARLALKYGHTPGFVGNQLRYVTDAKGEVTGVEPARTFRVSSHYDSGIVQREIEAKVAKLKPGKEFVVTEGEYV